MGDSRFMPRSWKLTTAEVVYIKKLTPQLNSCDEYRAAIDIEVIVHIQKIRLLKITNCSGTC